MKLELLQAQYTDECDAVTRNLANTLRTVHAHDYARRGSAVPHPYELPSRVDCYNCQLSRCEFIVRMLIETPIDNNKEAVIRFAQSSSH